MYVEEIALKSFRNYCNERICFSPGINVITGENAQGKTNLLEGLAFLSLGRSFRTSRDKELINASANCAYIRARVNENGIKCVVEALISQNAKSVKIDGLPIKRLGELFGRVLCVVFSPDDLRIIKDGPGVRRHFLNSEISKIKSAYYYDLQNYLKALSQKNSLLKSRMDAAKLKELAMVYNRQLAQYAAEIVKRRKSFCAGINEGLQEVYGTISGGRDSVKLKYRSCVDSEDVESALMSKYESCFAAEYEQKTTLYGIHREDVLFEIEGREAKTYASQGQLRTLTVALKLCVARVMKKYARCEPIVLLDDIFSELDSKRQSGLLDAAQGSQIIITTADRSIPALIGKQKNVYTICGGAVLNVQKSLLN